MVEVRLELGQPGNQHAMHSKLGTANQNHHRPEGILGGKPQVSLTWSCDSHVITHLLVEIHQQDSCNAAHALTVAQALEGQKEIASRQGLSLVMAGPGMQSQAGILQSKDPF